MLRQQRRRRRRVGSTTCKESSEEEEEGASCYPPATAVASVLAVAAAGSSLVPISYLLCHCLSCTVVPGRSLPNDVASYSFVRSRESWLFVLLRQVLGFHLDLGGFINLK